MMITAIEMTDAVLMNIVGKDIKLIASDLHSFRVIYKRFGIEQTFFPFIKKKL
jgi:hypothetical protein